MSFMEGWGEERENNISPFLVYFVRVFVVVFVVDSRLQRLVKLQRILPHYRITTCAAVVKVMSVFPL